MLKHRYHIPFDDGDCDEEFNGLLDDFVQCAKDVLIMGFDDSFAAGARCQSIVWALRAAGEALDAYGGAIVMRDGRILTTYLSADDLLGILCCEI